jgi:hypothetical protein
MVSSGRVNDFYKAVTMRLCLGKKQFSYSELYQHSWAVSWSFMPQRHSHNTTLTIV